MPFVVALAIGLFGTSSVWAQLPSESTLPGKRNASQAGRPPDLPRANSNLPSESILPGKSAADSNLATSPVSPTLKILLPAEGTLPRTPSKSPQQQIVQEEAEQPEAARPFVRLDLPGHTAPVRAIAFSDDGKTLFSGGDDKAVHIWQEENLLNSKRWLHRRTLRWQIRRGPAGVIYSLAQGGNKLAWGGYGATDLLGEIALASSPDSSFLASELERTLVDKNEKHRSVCSNLHFAPGSNGTLLLSSQLSGRIETWQQDKESGGWSKNVIQLEDEKRLSSQQRQELSSSSMSNRQYMPVAWIDGEHILVPRLDRQLTIEGMKLAGWGLDRVHVKNGRRTPLVSSALHVQSVTSLAVSADGKRAVSADATGQLFFWDLVSGKLQGAGAESLQGAAIALDLNSNGDRLSVGLARSPMLKNRAAIQTWNWNANGTRALAAQRECLFDVHAVRLRPGSTQVAYAQSNRIVLEESNFRDPRPLTLEPNSRSNVALTMGNTTAGDRLLLASKRDPSGKAVWDQAFDFKQMRPGLITAQDQLEVEAASVVDGWELRNEGAAGNESYQLFQKGLPRGKLPIDLGMDGAIVSHCWIKKPQSEQVAAIAFGTSGRSILVYEVPSVQDSTKQPSQTVQCKRLREFRAHEARISAMVVSKDQRYLISSGEDHLIHLWPLQGILEESLSERYWGGQFQVVDGQLKVAQSSPNGPLYHFGIKQGTVLDQLAWQASVGQSGESVVRATQAAEMQSQLQSPDPKLQYEFHWRRDRNEQQPFLAVPAWRPLLTLYLAKGNEWAAWTPAGVYDTSLSGERLFGWQVNRGLSSQPDFFSAAQFRKRLEKPDAIKRLWDAGSLDKAMVAGNTLPAEAATLVSNLAQLTPRLSWSTPAASLPANQSKLSIEMLVEFDDSVRLVEPKLYANGVVSSGATLVSSRLVNGTRSELFRWNAQLPPDRQLLLQAVVATDSDIAAEKMLTLNRSEQPDRKPSRMIIIGNGVDQYRDSQIPSLNYAVRNVQEIEKSLRANAGEQYSVQSFLMTNQQTHRALWRELTATLSSQLERELGASDVIVFLFSGHGVMDRETGEYYFVTHWANHADVMAGKYHDCLSMSELSKFSTIPCRKLIILDTCHSGAAILDHRRADLERQLHSLQNDQALFLTASQGDEEAVEQRDAQLGRFTRRFIEGVEGAADQVERGGNGDQLVDFVEISRFVRDTVPADSKGNEQRQNPQVGPAHLLPFVELPLTGRKSSLKISALNNSVLNYSAR